MNITVFLGSKYGNEEIYKNKVIELGKFIGENNHTLVYGGSNSGLMGDLALSTLKYHGKVIGVRPEGFKEGDLLKECNEMIITDSMSTRKDKLIELADLIIAFPGGTGTLDEISEVMVLRSTNLINKAYVFLNINGFYDTLYKFFLELYEKEFIDEKQLNQIIFINDINELKDYINNFIHF